MRAIKVIIRIQLDKYLITKDTPWMDLENDLNLAKIKLKEKSASKEAGGKRAP